MLVCTFGIVVSICWVYYMYICIRFDKYVSICLSKGTLLLDSGKNNMWWSLTVCLIVYPTVCLSIYLLVILSFSWYFYHENCIFSTFSQWKIQTAPARRNQEPTLRSMNVCLQICLSVLCSVYIQLHYNNACCW